MSNTMLAERQTNSAEYYMPLESDTVRFQPITPPVSKRQAAQAKRKKRGDWLVVAVLLVCTVTTCTIGVIYVAAFAQVTLQSQQISEINSGLAAAEGQHEALIKETAFLQSDDRITPRAIAMKMSQSGTSMYIDVPLTQPADSREVASAL